MRSKEKFISKNLECTARTSCLTKDSKAISTRIKNLNWHAWPGKYKVEGKRGKLFRDFFFFLFELELATWKSRRETRPRFPGGCGATKSKVAAELVNPPEHADEVAGSAENAVATTSNQTTVERSRAAAAYRERPQPTEYWCQLFFWNFSLFYWIVSFSKFASIGMKIHNLYMPS